VATSTGQPHCDLLSEGKHTVANVHCECRSVMPQPMTPDVLLKHYARPEPAQIAKSITDVEGRIPTAAISCHSVRRPT
jgi:hypothetical protein